MKSNGGLDVIKVYYMHSQKCLNELSNIIYIQSQMGIEVHIYHPMTKQAEAETCCMHVPDQPGLLSKFKAVQVTKQHSVSNDKSKIH